MIFTSFVDLFSASCECSRVYSWSTRKLFSRYFRRFYGVLGSFSALLTVWSPLNKKHLLFREDSDRKRSHLPVDMWSVQFFMICSGVRL